MVFELSYEHGSISQLARIREATFLKIPGVGRKYASLIQKWQKQAQFSDESEWVERNDTGRCHPCA